MKYSSILKYDRFSNEVDLLSWRGGGEALPSGAVPVAARAFGNLSDEEYFIDTTNFVLLGWSNFSREDIRSLLKNEAKYWGSNYDPSVVFERTQCAIEALANEPRFCGAVAGWTGKKFRIGDTEAARAALKRITKNGTQKVLLSWKGVAWVIGPTD